MTGQPVLDVRGVTKTYGMGETEVQALRGMSLTVRRGGYLAIMGSSGSGQATLMNIPRGLDIPPPRRDPPDGVGVSRLPHPQLAPVPHPPIGVLFHAVNPIP